MSITTSQEYDGTLYPGLMVRDARLCAIFGKKQWRSVADHLERLEVKPLVLGSARWWSTSSVINGMQRMIDQQNEQDSCNE